MITRIKFLVKISLLERKKPKVRRLVNQNGSIKIVTKLSKSSKRQETFSHETKLMKIAYPLSERVRNIIEFDKKPNDFLK